MKRLVYGTAVALVGLLAGPALGSDFIVASEPFTPGAELGSSEPGRYHFEQRPIYTIESGSRDGVEYQIHYNSGSGNFASSGSADQIGSRIARNYWLVGCRRDVMDDTKRCYVQREDLWVWVYSDGSRRVSIGAGKTYPNTPASIRVDSASPVASPVGTEGVFGPRGTKDAIEQMLQGQQIATRYIDWPYRSNVDKTMSLHGFRQAYEYLEWALANSR